MKQALVIYANGSEDLEVTAISDVLARGGVSVIKAAVGSSCEVKLAHGTRVKCDKLLEECNDNYDVIAIPGGLKGSENCRDCALLIQKLKDQKAAKRIVAAICAAPGFVLATHGIIDEEKATGYPGCCDNVKNYTGNGVEKSDDELIITGKGPAYAVPFALELLKALEGNVIAEKVAKGMLY